MLVPESGCFAMCSYFEFLTKWIERTVKSPVAGRSNSVALETTGHAREKCFWNGRVTGILRDGDVIRPIVWIDWLIDDVYQGIEARLEVEIVED